MNLCNVIIELQIIISLAICLMHKQRYIAEGSHEFTLDKPVAKYTACMHTDASLIRWQVP
jgi:hypothetical protein